MCVLVLRFLLLLSKCVFVCNPLRFCSWCSWMQGSAVMPDLWLSVSSILARFWRVVEYFISTGGAVFSWAGEVLVLSSGSLGKMKT